MRNPFSKTYFVNLFYEPGTLIEDAPANQNVLWEEVRFPGMEGQNLHGYFFRPKDSALGTVVHCHGNTGNMTRHLANLMFLVRAGYNLFTFDYQGFGESDGMPSPRNIVEDTHAALRYIRCRSDIETERIYLFGQSLGGAPATAAMAEDKAVRALILEATFTTYRRMAKETRLGRFLFFLVSWAIPDVGPLKDLPRIAPRPILIIHGDKDTKVPAHFGQELYDAAQEQKSLVILKGVGHLKGEELGPPYESAILTFLSKNRI